MRTLVTGISVCLAALALGGCASQPAVAPVTLYQELGGERGVDTIVGEMLLNVVEDERVGEIFANSNLARLRRLLAEQFCALAGGPCTYSGFSMRESHRGMAVTEVEFNAVVQALADALDQLEVAVPTQNRLLARLAPLRDDIVYQ